MPEYPSIASAHASLLCPEREAVWEPGIAINLNNVPLIGLSAASTEMLARAS